MEYRISSRRARRLVVPLQLILLLALTGRCVHDPFLDSGVEREPGVPGCAGDGTVCFESSVLPVFVSSCAVAGCHDAATHEEGFLLDSYTNIVRRGIVPGDAGESKLYEVLFKTGEDQMPPGAPLSKAQKDSIAAWINQGARNTIDCNCYCDPGMYSYAAIIEPLVKTNCVGCHKPSSAGGGIDLSTYSSLRAQADNGKLMGSITHASGFVPMPQGGKLSDCEITQLQKWVEEGAPNN